MKKCWVIIWMALFLSGCGVQETFETLADDYDLSVMAQMQQLHITLPPNAAVTTMENDDTGKIYLCDGYTVTVQTMPAGDLDGTLRQVTGFSKDQLTLMQTRMGNVIRYECVWSAVGEGGDQVCRAAILDDGCYHYAITAMADAELAGQLTQTWQGILQSATLSTD